MAIRGVIQLNLRLVGLSDGLCCKSSPDLDSRNSDIVLGSLVLLPESHEV